MGNLVERFNFSGVGSMLVHRVGGVRRVNSARLVVLLSQLDDDQKQRLIGRLIKLSQTRGVIL